MDKKYPKAQALKLIKRILGNGATILTSHLKDMMIERNFNIQDITHAIKHGNIYDEPEIHQRTNRWIYTVESRTIDGEKIKVIIDICEEENKVIILTGIIK